MLRRQSRVFLVMALLLCAPLAGGQVRTPGAGESSDLFLVLVNQTTGRSEVIDLGPVDAVVAVAGRWMLDGRYAVRLGPGRLTYQLLAADLSAQGPNGFAGSTLYVSAGSASERLMTPRVWTSFGIVTAVSVADSQLAAAAHDFKPLGGHLVLRSRGSPATNWGPLNARIAAPGRELGMAGFDATGEVGRELAFYRVVAGAKDFADDATGRVTLLGRFLLKGTVLKFSPLPVP
ncbi:MAG: hypothetical protein WCH32_09760 [Pseudomonadota bacterium]